MAFVRRQLSATITLAGQGEAVTLPSPGTADTGALRMRAQISKAAAPTFDTCELWIWGLAPAVMTQVSRLGVPLSLIRNNGLQVSAGDDASGLGLVFSGTIMQAAQEFQGAPDTPLHISARGGGLGAMVPVPPVGAKGPVSVVNLLTTVAGSMQPNPLALENNGVTAMLPSSYFPGTATQQIEAIARAANIYARIEDETNTLAIWPKNGSRVTAGRIPLIAAPPLGGMIGYPTWADLGVAVRSEYFPGLKVGQLFALQSAVIPAASKDWYLATLEYDLACESPDDGPWFMDLTGADISGWGSAVIASLTAVPP